MHIRRIAGRGLLVVAGVLMALSAATAALLAYPEPLYAHVASSGRLSLHSDRPFSISAGQAVLVDIERRLAAAPVGIADPDSTYRIFVSNDETRRRLTLLWNYGAGGVNYYPIAGSVFIRQADINRDRLLGSDGRDVPPPRTLAYFGAHEVAHSLIGQRVGAIANWRMPVWVREGLADYVGFGGDVDVNALAQQFRAGHRDLDPAASGLYARYRMLVAWMLEHEGWTVDELLASGMPQEEAEARLLAGLPE